jgi:hypothetical protein
MAEQSIKPGDAGQPRDIKTGESHAFTLESEVKWWVALPTDERAGVELVVGDEQGQEVARLKAGEAETGEDDACGFDLSKLDENTTLELQLCRGEEPLGDRVQVKLADFFRDADAGSSEPTTTYLAGIARESGDGDGPDDPEPVAGEEDEEPAYPPYPREGVA